MIEFNADGHRRRYALAYLKFQTKWSIDTWHEKVIKKHWLSKDTTSNKVYSFGANSYHQCSIHKTDERYHDILEPYQLSKNEMNINPNLLIEEILAGIDYSLIMVNEHSFISNGNKIAKSAQKRNKKRKFELI